LVFLDRDPGKADNARRVLTEQIEREKLQVAGFRLLPTDASACGLEHSKPSRPLCNVRERGPRYRRSDVEPQAVHGAPPHRKDLEGTDPVFYIPSLSASTIVYKGMVMPLFLAQFYPD